MKHLTILVPNGENNLSSIVGVYKIFNRANAIYASKGFKAVFKIELVGTSQKVGFYDDLFTVKPHKKVSEIKKTDFIIIPSLNHNFDSAVHENKEIINWIAKQYRLGAEVASICTGAFLLATTGLLDGKKCSTHWSAVSIFKQRFPGIHLQPDQLITDENRIYTNGGAYSFLNLILYLIEKFYDRETALLCSKIFQIDVSRSHQSEFMIFNGQKNHDDGAILEAQEYLEKYFQEKISIASLSSKLHITRRNFDRRFIKATGITPLDYLQRVKIEAAKKQLENYPKTVTEVMYTVGYNDAKAFRDVFSRITGLSPVDYKLKYNKFSNSVLS
ncbi:GlxA family transcriptional regulator [Flavobacterium sp. J27]|uniref:GlxA family transcriptional regulator n=1 Tax=Flavobacterium sp. J27 TaxID=2060419 RepID=UPI0010323A14|nr:helix-turn-helix domain-containing protein [Flavobacterium sp. J27]